MEDKIVIGEILKPQGIKGEIKVKALIPDISVINSKDIYFVNGKECTLKDMSFRQGFLFITFNEFQDRNTVELLRGKKIYMQKESVQEGLEDGEYFIEDILGFDCLVDGKKIGELDDVQNFGSKDVYYVNTENGKQVLFPVIPNLIENINLETKQIILNKEVFEQVAVYED